MGPPVGSDTWKPNPSRSDAGLLLFPLGYQGRSPWLVSFCRETRTPLRDGALGVLAAVKNRRSSFLLLGNSRLPPCFCGKTAAVRRLLKPAARQLHPQNKPPLQQLTQSPVVAQLLLHHGHLLRPHKLTVALSLPGETQLIVRTMLPRRIRFAAALEFPADVVLLREANPGAGRPRPSSPL